MLSSFTSTPGNEIFKRECQPHFPTIFDRHWHLQSPVMAEPDRSSIYVAPLFIQKAKPIQKVKPVQPRTIFVLDSATLTAQRARLMTPPLTPQCAGKPTEEPEVHEQTSQPQFNNYLKAFCAFEPSSDESSSTVQLRLSPGDLVLVHSINPNGWADGTLLSSGDRGWLPSNYCLGYDPKPIQELLKALTNIWELMQDNGDGILSATPTSYSASASDYKHGLIAGVRCLLVRSLLHLRRARASATLPPKSVANYLAGENWLFG